LELHQSKSCQCIPYREIPWRDLVQKNSATTMERLTTTAVSRRNHAPFNCRASGIIKLFRDPPHGVHRTTRSASTAGVSTPHTTYFSDANRTRKLEAHPHHLVRCQNHHHRVGCCSWQLVVVVGDCFIGEVVVG
jgi:hypothetical protein